MSDYLLYLCIGFGAGALAGAMVRVRSAIASGLGDSSLDR